MIKKKLIKKIINILKRNGINYWLFDRTLLFAEKMQKFSNDKKDFIGIWKIYEKLFRTFVTCFK